MGYYLDIHIGDTSDGQITPEQAHELLLRDGAHQEGEDGYSPGAIWFAGGMGHIISTPDKREVLQRERCTFAELLPADAPQPIDKYTRFDRELVSFRYSWGMSWDYLREVCLKLLVFCSRHHLRLYDGQAEMYVTEDTVDEVLGTVQKRLKKRSEAVRELCDPLGGGIDIESARSPDRSIDDLGLSVRSRNMLQRMGIQTLGELVSQTGHELECNKYFDQTSLREIKATLAKLGLTLRKPETPSEPAISSDSDMAPGNEPTPPDIHARPAEDTLTDGGSSKPMEKGNMDVKWFFSVRPASVPDAPERQVADPGLQSLLMERLISAGAVDFMPDGPNAGQFLLLDKAVIQRPSENEAPPGLVAKVVFSGSVYDALRLLWVLVRVCESLGLCVYDDQMRRNCTRENIPESVNFVGSGCPGEGPVEKPRHHYYVWCERQCGLWLADEKPFLGFAAQPDEQRRTAILERAKQEGLLGIVQIMPEGCPRCISKGSATGPVRTFGWVLAPVEVPIPLLTGVTVCQTPPPSVKPTPDGAQEAAHGSVAGTQNSSMPSKGYYYRCQRCGLMKLKHNDDFTDLMSPEGLLAVRQAISSGAVGATHRFHGDGGCPHCNPDGPWKFDTVALRIQSPSSKSEGCDASPTSPAPQ